MKRLEAEDQVQLADILKEPVKSFNEDLDEVDQSERRLGRRRYENEVKSRVVSVCDLGRHIRRGSVSIRSEEGRER